MANYYENQHEYSYTKSKEEFQEDLKKKIKDTLKSNERYEPVTISEYSRTICKSWWGQSWCKNLERYADYENRIGRGKSYFRMGTVVDLKIYDNSSIYAKVQGARKWPYKVKIFIRKLSEANRIKMEKLAAGKIQNLEALISGNFPRELKDLFFQENGLFPTPREINFECDCPDWAHMCKHIAAALYAVGVVLDNNPLYFFQLRGIDVDDFLDSVVNGKVQNMLKNANVKSPRIIKDADLLQMFGIQ